jgi:hypothetical protein
MATNARNRHLEPCYKQHTAVDDKMGVTLDVEVTTGEKNEGEMIAPQVDEVIATTGVDIKTVTADAGYAYAKVYGALERRGRQKPSRSDRASRCAVFGMTPSTISYGALESAFYARLGPRSTVVFSTLKPRTARAVR